MPKPLIALTMGDPAGIGPEIVLKAAARSDIRRRCTPVVFGDAAWLARNLSRLPVRHSARRLTLAVFPQLSSTVRVARSVLAVIDLKNVDPRVTVFGRPSAAAGQASGDYIAAAVEAVRRGDAAALVTAPINKISFSRCAWGRRFVGHTEMLAALTHTRKARLMLVHGALRAVHVTSHIPLSRVASTLTIPMILDTIRISHDSLRAIGLRNPRIAVCGLNPHSGDGGVLGNEERRIISPAIARARRAGIRVDGPISADVVWPAVLAGRYDAGVAMYHDQGQIAIKLFGFRRMGAAGVDVGGVNITLGLPIVRTSPAHGTAFDIAGRGRASEESLAQAILTAVSLVRRR